MNTEKIRRMFRVSSRPVLLGGVVLAVGLAVGWSAADARLDAASARPAPVTAAEMPQAPQGRATAMRPIESYADIVAQVAPAVVTVRTERVVREAASGPFGDDPFFRQFFGQQGHNFNVRPQPREEGGLGSGVIVSPDGYILTNAHVVEGANRVRVELADRRTFVAKLIGADKPSDLAVLKIEASGLRSLPLGDARQVRVGDVVLAVGNPLGVGQTVTSGIISAKGRATGGTADGSFEDFLQTDAPINRGNSGGALVNTRGELVGINSQILSPSGGSIGIGFAIPINLVRDLLPQLRAGKVIRGKIGVRVQEVPRESVADLGLRQRSGALVAQVDKDTPAAKAGIEPGDVIVEFGGKPVASRDELIRMVTGTKPGTTVPAKILRDKKERNVSITVEELDLEAESSGAPSNENGPEDTSAGFGMTLGNITPNLSRQLRLPAGTTGAVVTDIDPGGPAAGAGLSQYDVILKVNGAGVASAADASRLLQKVPSGGRAMLLVWKARQNQELFLTIKKE
jgi:Do/DeqQ family serine protease